MNKRRMAEGIFERTCAVIALLGLYKNGSVALGRIGLDVRNDNDDMGFSMGSRMNGSL